MLFVIALCLAATEHETSAWICGAVALTNLVGFIGLSFAGVFDSRPRLENYLWWIMMLSALPMM